MQLDEYQRIFKDVERLESQLGEPEGQLVGLRASLLANAYYYLADGEYLINKNKSLYAQYNKKGVMLRKTFFQLYDQGEERHWSRVTMLNYQNLFRALASGDMEFSYEFAKIMGGRDKAEKKNDHPFDYNLGYLLKYLVLNEKEKAFEFLGKFDEICKKGGNKRYASLLPVFGALLKEDSFAFNEGIKDIKKDYLKLRNATEASPFKYLNTWVIGLANLAIHRGMRILIEDEYIPGDLLVEG